jgi:hypothetical protein
MIGGTGLHDASATNAPQLDSQIQEWMVPALVVAIYQHRRRIDELLTRVGPARRTAVEMSVSALLDGTVDVTTLVARITESCRDGDRRVQTLVEMLTTRADRVDKYAG